jgi:formate/nitrite transporter
MYWAAPSPDTGVLALTPIGIKALAIAKGKLALSWSSAFFRGILCNWLVCLAVWMALAAKDITGKIFAIFFPIMAFVTSGFEHCVANMFFIPMGLAIAKAAPDLAAAQGIKPEVFSIHTFITANLIPVTLGNIVGGALLVGGVYYLIYLRSGRTESSGSKNTAA